MRFSLHLSPALLLQRREHAPSPVAQMPLVFRVSHDLKFRQRGLGRAHLYKYSGTRRGEPTTPAKSSRATSFHRFPSNMIGV